MELKQERYTRVIFPGQGSADAKLAYLIMVLAYPVDLEAHGGLERGYDQYRETRAALLEAYCLVILYENRHLNSVVAIGMDAHSSQTGRKGGSEDLFAMRIDEWTDELVACAVEAKEDYDILRGDRLIKQKLSRNEYPILGEPIERRWPKHRSSPQRYRKKK
jgi:hypothetical protein